MKLLIVCFCFVPTVSLGQYVRPSIELLVGSNYYKSSKLYDHSIDYHGVSFYYGLKHKCIIGNYVAITATGGLKAYPFDGDYYSALSVQAFVYRDFQTGFSAFVEVGAELSDWGGLTLPFYLGTTQYFGNQLAFNFRVRIPTFIDVTLIKWAGHIESGLEVSLQYDFIWKKQRPISRFGNPFILN